MKFTVGRKLALGFGTIVALMVASTAMAFLEVSKIEELQTRVSKLRVPTIVASKDVQRDMNQLANKGRRAVLSADYEKSYQDGKRLYAEQAELVVKDFARLDEKLVRMAMV